MSYTDIALIVLGIGTILNSICILLLEHNKSNRFFGSIYRR